MLTMKTIMSQIQGGLGLVCHYRAKGCIFSHPGRSAAQEVPSVCLWMEGLPIPSNRYLPQAFRPHGSGLPCVAPRVASHEAVPLVDERAEVPHLCQESSWL